MAEPIRTDPSRLKVYALLAEGRAQTRIRKITGLDKGYISRTAKVLVDGGYLVPIKGTKKPIIYEKGPRGPELDKIVVDSKLIVYTSGVTDVAENYKRVDTGKVHHKKFKMKVLKEGDLRYYNVGKIYRNVQRSLAEVPYHNRFIKVEVERSFKKGGKGTTMYIYAPDLDLTKEEMPHQDEIARKIVTEVSSYMIKNLGWDLGPVEDTNWQTHIGIDNPALMKGIAEKFYMRSTDSKVWASNSDGRSEHETSDVEYAQVMLDLPGQVVTLRSTVGGLVEDLKLVVEALSLAKEGMENVAAINGIELRTKAKEVMDKMRDVPEDPALASEDGKKEKYGGMYR